MCSMSSANEPHRRQSWSSGHQVSSSTSHSSSRTAYTPTQDIEMISLPACAISPSSHADRPEDRSIQSSTPRPPHILRLWREHITVTVDRKDSRDHLALERTFLGYMRTSTLLALTGVVVAQLTLLQQRDTGFGYSLVGRPLSIFCYASAIWTVLSGAFRAWRYQRALVQGKALSGGLEIGLVALLVLALAVIFLGLTIAIDTVPHPQADNAVTYGSSGSSI
ncbi:hypothetical protein F4809DRAFT_629313 [Biscogniauxia mediterranea]|nr:hypothetical protein F4809DRAFT_629313 [Biscogniauxia mediterranea]